MNSNESMQPSCSFNVSQAIFQKPILLKYNEVTMATGLSRIAIRKAVKAGTFPAPVLLSPRKYRWRGDDLQAWFEGLPKAGGVLC